MKYDSLLPPKEVDAPLQSILFLPCCY